MVPGEAEIEPEEEGLDPTQADLDDEGPPVGNWKEGGKFPVEYVVLEGERSTCIP